VITLFTIFSFIFDVDYARFKISPYLYVVEVYYASPYERFKFKRKGEESISEYTLCYSVYDLKNRKSLSDTLRRIIKLYKGEDIKDMWFFDYFSFYAGEGRYRVDMKVLTDSDTFSSSLNINIEENQKTIFLSDPVICVGISKDGRYGINKGNIKILPNPSLKVERAKSIMGIYYEVYNTREDSTSYDIYVKILDSLGNTIKNFDPMRREKVGKETYDAIALNIQALKEGRYKLFIRVKDNSTNEEDTAYKDFYVFKKPKKEVFSRRYDTLFYLWASREEITQYKRLTEKGKRFFLERFWSTHDYNEFEKRIMIAETSYRVGGLHGWETDRGKIYIKYGNPSEVEKKSFGEGFIAYEHWHYYEGNMHFVFADKKGTGEFELIFSSEEPFLNDPKWQEYVDEEDRKILESILK